MFKRSNRSNRIEPEFDTTGFKNTFNHNSLPPAEIARRKQEHGLNSVNGYELRKREQQLADDYAALFGRRRSVRRRSHRRSHRKSHRRSHRSRKHRKFLLPQFSPIKF